MAKAKATQKSVTVLPPIGGWNVRDPVDAMDPLDAVELINVIPLTSTIRTRKGYRTHQGGLGSGDNVETLASYTTSSGVPYLLAGANGNVYDVTSLGGSPSSLASGFSSNRWQAAQFNGRIFFVNGTDTPQSFDGSIFGNPGFTGTTVAELSHVNSFKNRLYFVRGTSLWYGGLDSITGALTEFPCASLLTNGGRVLFSATLTLATGTAEDHQLVIVGENGDVLIYGGTFPGGTWALSRRVTIPKPMGARAHTAIDNDLIIATESGVVSLSATLQGGTNTTITSKIDPVWQQFTQAYKSLFGWQVLWNRGDKYLLLNVPTSATTFDQIYLNLETGAASKLQGLHAHTWCMHEAAPYFGGVSTVNEFANGELDASIQSVSYKIRPAFNHFGDRATTKRFCAILPIVTYSKSTSVKFALDTNLEQSLDLQQVDLINEITSWDFPWDSPWSDEVSSIYEWMAIGAAGRSLSVGVQGDNQGASLTLQSAQVIYEQGGIL